MFDNDEDRAEAIIEALASNATREQELRTILYCAEWSRKNHVEESLQVIHAVPDDGTNPTTDVQRVAELDAQITAIRSEIEAIHASDEQLIAQM